jgi:hypothetical protein
MCGRSCLNVVTSLIMFLKIDKRYICIVLCWLLETKLFSEKKNKYYYFINSASQEKDPINVNPHYIISLK